MKTPKAAACTAASEIRIIENDEWGLAASSSGAGLEVASADARAIVRPTRVDPVEVIRLTAGCAINSATSAGASAGALVMG